MLHLIIHISAFKQTRCFNCNKKRTNLNKTEKKIGVEKIIAKRPNKLN